MKALLVLGAGTLLLAGCGGGSSAVGANSADSVTTTAVGNVVATIPSPTPTPTETPVADNTATAADAMTDDSAPNAAAIDTAQH